MGEEATEEDPLITDDAEQSQQIVLSVKYVDGPLNTEHRPMRRRTKTYSKDIRI